jgi:hypothetical protein
MKNTLSLSSIVLELQSRGSTSPANQITPKFGNRRRRARSTYLPKKFCDSLLFVSGFGNPRSPLWGSMARAHNACKSNLDHPQGYDRG